MDGVKEHPISMTMALEMPSMPCNVLMCTPHGIYFSTPHSVCFLHSSPTTVPMSVMFRSGPDCLRQHDCKLRNLKYIYIESSQTKNTSNRSRRTCPPSKRCFSRAFRALFVSRERTRSPFQSHFGDIFRSQLG